MSKIVMRRIVVDEQTYLWRRRHRHVDTQGGAGCEEILTVYAEGFGKSALRLVFISDAEWGAGDFDAGVIYARHDKLSYNLNRPAVIAALIRHMRQQGWQPQRERTPRIEAQAIPLLALSHAPREKLPPRRS